jgi:hypothetical protein
VRARYVSAMPFAIAICAVLGMYCSIGILFIDVLYAKDLLTWWGASGCMLMFGGTVLVPCGKIIVSTNGGTNSLYVQFLSLRCRFRLSAVRVHNHRVLCVFPSGMVIRSDAKSWRGRSFEVAARTQDRV